MKKIMTLLLSVVLVFCMVPASAFGAVTPLTASIGGATSTLYTGKAMPLPQVTVVNASGALQNQSLYTVQWTKKGQVVSGNQTDAGVYMAKVTPTDQEHTITPTDFKYEIKPINLYDGAVLEYTGTLKKSEFQGWDTIPTGGVVRLPDSTKSCVTIKQDGVAIDESLYQAPTGLKTGTDTLRINVSAVTGQAPNVIESTIAKEVTLTSDLSTDYKIVASNGSNTIPDQTYTGSPIKPTIYVVPISQNGIYGALRENVDYKLEYFGNLNGGSVARVVVTGIGKYSGKLEKNFFIKGKSILGTIVTVDNTPQGVTPNFTVKDGNKILVKGQDYNAIPNSSIVGIGQGSLTIIGMNSYEGTKVVPFNVVANNIATAEIKQVASGSKQYNGYSQAPMNLPLLMDGSKPLRLNQDYKLEYEYFDTNTSLATTTNPVDAKHYDVYAVGINTYGGRVKVGTFDITQIPFNNAAPTYALTITATQGIAVNKPNVVVKTTYGSILFKEGKDYVISSATVSQYTGKGRVTVTSTGTGNIAAGVPITVEYSVANKSLSLCTAYFLGNINAVNYTGGNITLPEILVYDGTTRLINNVNYTVTIKDEQGKLVTYLKDAGTYKVILTGKGLYNGTKELTFVVKGISISGYTVTLKENSTMANGLIKLPIILSVKNSANQALLLTDYTVSYQDSTGKTVTQLKDAGVYKVVVTGRKGYMGSAYATYTIKGLPQTITIDKTVYKTYENWRTVTLDPTANGDGKGFTYTSSDESVATVSANGVVTPHKMGRAVITINTYGTTKYDPASERVVIKVYPKKAKITKKPWTQGKNNFLRVRWNKQEGATKYQIQYCRNSKFKKGTYGTKTVNALDNRYTTQSTGIKNLVGGNRYYVKVRTIKEVTNDYGKTLTYYGRWSKWRSVVTK